MTGCRKVFLDTAPLIYFLDDDANYIQTVKGIFTEMLSNDIPMVSSVITCEEYLVFGQRQKRLPESVRNIRILKGWMPCSLHRPAFQAVMLC